VILGYPYLRKEDYPKHAFPRLSFAEAREGREELFGSEGKERDREGDEAAFQWWSKYVLDSTKDSYEGLSDDWKNELWNHKEGKWHIIHAFEQYFELITPRRPT
jgi:hypothetical protein